MNKMNPEVKQMWIEALESGKYKQVTGGLGRGDKFCCLGVLSELAVSNGIISKQIHLRYDEEIYLYGEDEDTNYLPAKVQEWAGLDYRDPVVLVVLVESEDNAKVHLSTLNDCGNDFKTIAEYIRKCL